MMSAEARFRVQIVNKPMSPRTGIGRYATELECGLCEAGVDVRSAPLKTPLPAPVKAGARRAGFDLETFFESYPLRAELRPGYITHLTSQTLASLLLTQRVPRPVVVTVHDILPYLLRDDPELNVYRNRAQRWMDALAMRGLQRADLLIADSEYTKITLIDALSVPEERIAVVHLGVDTDHFRPLDVPPQFMDRYGLPAERRYLLFVGSDEPRKNLPALLRALPRVREEHPDVALIKVGAPGAAEWREKHLHLCRELRITRDVYWFDDVPDDDLPLFYNLAAVFVFPSLYEGFGLPVLEARACGTPVVGASTSVVSDIEEDTPGLLDELSSDAVASALTSIISAPFQTCCASLRQRTVKSQWATTTADTMGVYSGLSGLSVPTEATS